MVHILNEGYRAWGALKSVLCNRGLGIKAKKCLYEGVIIPNALYGAEAWDMRSAERRKVNVLEMKCLRSLVGVSRMDRARNEEVHRRAGVERELASRADQRALLLLKKVGSAKLRESNIHPISPKTPAPQYQPIDRKKERVKRVEDYSRDRAA